MTNNYDVLVWWNQYKQKNGKVMCRSLTNEGAIFIQRKIKGNYIVGEPMELTLHPSEFKAILPKGLKVGTKHPESKKIYPFLSPPLQ